MRTLRRSAQGRFYPLGWGQQSDVGAPGSGKRTLQASVEGGLRTLERRLTTGQHLTHLFRWECPDSARLDCIRQRRISAAVPTGAPGTADNQRNDSPSRSRLSGTGQMFRSLSKVFPTTPANQTTGQSQGSYGDFGRPEQGRGRRYSFCPATPSSVVLASMKGRTWSFVRWSSICGQPLASTPR